MAARKKTRVKHQDVVRESAADKKILFGVFALFVGIASVVTFMSSSGVQGLSAVEDADLIWADVIVDHVDRLHGAEIELRFNPAVATFSHMESGTLVTRDGADVFVSDQTVQAEDGVVRGAYLVRLHPTGISGSGAIASFAFRAAPDADLAFSLEHLVLANDNAESISPVGASIAVRQENAETSGTSSAALFVVIVLAVAALCVLALHKKRKKKNN